MRKSKSTCSVVIGVVLVIMPQLAKAGPCTSDIAEWETTIQQPGVEALAKHSWPQLSATIARAKRLDMYGDRLGCTGALNAVRAMSVLVARE